MFSAVICQEFFRQTHKYWAINESGAQIKVEISRSSDPLWTNCSYEFTGMDDKGDTFIEISGSSIRRLEAQESESTVKKILDQFYCRHARGVSWADKNGKYEDEFEVYMQFRVVSRSVSRIELEDDLDPGQPHLMLFSTAAWLFNNLWPVDNDYGRLFIDEAVITPDRWNGQKFDGLIYHQDVYAQPGLPTTPSAPAPTAGRASSTLLPPDLAPEHVSTKPLDSTPECFAEAGAPEAPPSPPSLLPARLGGDLEVPNPKRKRTSKYTASQSSAADDSVGDSDCDSIGSQDL